MNKAAIIGYGNMGSAFTRAILNAFPKCSVIIIEADRDRRQQAQSIKNSAVMAPSEAAAVLKDAKPDICLLAVKPGQLENITDIIQSCDNSLIVSIMAGISLDKLNQHSPDCKAVRMMPNLAAEYAHSVTAFCPNQQCTKEDIVLAKTIAEGAGLAVQIEEQYFASIIGLAGSGIAYAFQFLHAMALGGVQTGLAYNQSLELAIETVKGACEVIKQSGISPSEYITRVCSPGGTTIQGIASLEHGCFTDTVMKAVTSAADHSRMMERHK
ncbi:MAG: pyrroline-5-carboxylate reductase [Spirochaetaceae bacterium]|nr:MAG: pyrroline-5-carboxylate reductase [Spirochaetaceae bacterium]